VKYWKYGRKASRIVKRYEQYGRKIFSLLFFHIFHLISQFSSVFSKSFSLLNLLFFHNLHIISLFSLLFFHTLHILSGSSSICNVTYISGCTCAHPRKVSWMVKW
jgi:hypothetical protein